MGNITLQRMLQESEKNFKYQFQDAYYYSPENGFLLLRCLLRSIGALLTSVCTVPRVCVAQRVLFHHPVIVHLHLEVTLLVGRVSIDAYPHRALEVRRNEHGVLAAGGRLQLVVIKAWVEGAV